MAEQNLHTKRETGTDSNLRLVSFPEATVVRAERLTKVFVSPFRRRKVRALDGLDLEVTKGEIFGLLGPNGAGKSTTIKLMIGLLRPTSGTVTLFGRAPADVEARGSLGYLAENPSFYPYLTGLEFLDYCGGLLGLNCTARRRRAVELLQQMALWDARDLRIKKYSKGMVQRLGFAQALLGDPDLLILDEPMSGLDPIGRRLVREGIFEVKARGGTVLFSSHILPDVETICDRVGIIAHGRLQRVIALNQDSVEENALVEVILDRLDAQTAQEVQRRCSTLRRRGDTYIFQFDNTSDAEAALNVAVIRGARVLGYNRLKDSLENVFIKEIEPQESMGERKAG